MRRAAALALMMILLCACGAGERGEERFRIRREEISGAEKISFVLEVTTDMGGEIFTCSLVCEYADGVGRVTIEEPEGLRGITADTKKGTVEYDGVELYIGEPAGNMSPVASADVFAHAMLDAFVQRVYTEQNGEILAVSTYLDERSEATVYYDNATLTPVAGEIFRDGVRTVHCGIRNFSAK